MLNRTCAVLGLALVLAASIGCRPAGYAPPPSTGEAAAQIKQQVDEFVSKVRQQPKTAVLEVTLLLESLEAAVNQYGDEFASTRDSARTLQELYARSAGRAEIESQLNVLADAAAAADGS